MDELERLIDEVQRADAVRDRQRERWLRQIEEEGATLAGALLDLTEQGSTVTVDTSDGSYRGRLRMVGQDFCVLAGDAGEVWLALDAVAAVRPHPAERHGAATGSRPPTDLRLGEALSHLVAERPRVSVVLGGGRRTTGVLRGVGRDVMSLELDGDEAAVAYVSLGSVRAILRSG
jgi:hypothetical protein